MGEPAGKTVEDITWLVLMKEISVSCGSLYLKISGQLMIGGMLYLPITQYKYPFIHGNAQYFDPMVPDRYTDFITELEAARPKSWNGILHWQMLITSQGCSVKYHEA